MHDPTHPIISRALRAVRAFGDDLKPADAKRALDLWQHVAELSDREYVAVLGWLGWTRRTCARCGALVLFVAEGPQPGWWEHDLVPAEDHPHPAEPEVGCRRDGRQPAGAALAVLDPDETVATLACHLPAGTGTTQVPEWRTGDVARFLAEHLADAGYGLAALRPPATGPEVA